jgi:hypothetical protein
MPKRSARQRPQFPMTGRFLAALRETCRQNRERLAEKAGISLDQVARLERGENLGIWYVAAVVSALDPNHDAATGLMAALKMDGRAVIAAGELKRRIKDKSEGTGGVAKPRPKTDQEKKSRGGFQRRAAASDRKNHRARRGAKTP